MDIKLPIALNTVVGSLLHVSERVPAGAVLVCPFCRHSVKKNAGNTRRHHYVHMPGANCSVSTETLLHEGAKVFLHSCLQKREAVDILIDIATLRPSKTKKLLENMEVNRLSISSESVCKTTKASAHYLEKSIGSIRPDIVSCGGYSGSGRDVFAWEIFVTHEIEDKKADVLKKGGIPYVELSPVEEGSNGYIFRLVSYGGISFMDDDIDLHETIYKENKTDLIKIFKRQMSQEIINGKLAEAERIWESASIDRIRDETIRHVRQNVDKLSPKDVISLTKAFSTIIYPVTQMFGNTIIYDEKWEEIKNIECEKYDSRYSVKVNGKYLFQSALGMLRGIYEHLAKSGLLMGLVATDKLRGENKLVGVKLSLPIPTKAQIAECLSLLHNYSDVPTEEIEIWETSSRKSRANGKYYMLANEDILVDSYDVQLKNVINHLLRYFKVNAHLIVDDKKKLKIDAIKVRGLCNIDEMKSSLVGIISR